MASLARRIISLGRSRISARIIPIGCTSSLRTSHIYVNSFARLSSTSTMAQQFMQTSGARESVWIHKDPVSNRPRFSALSSDVDTDICIVGAGIAGISTAYELVKRGHQVVLLEARDVLSGETGRTSGHLTDDLDDGFIDIAKKHGQEGARLAAESHGWARDHVGEVAQELGIECEYRKLPSYTVSQYPVGKSEHDDEMKGLREECEKQKDLGFDSIFDENLKVKGWTGSVNQKGGLIVRNQATFHPTKYLNGVLNWLKSQPNFSCYTHTRVMSVEEKGFEILGLGKKTVEVRTESGNTIRSNYAVEATNVPLQKLSVIVEMESMRSYCIAARVPKGSVEDCLLYDEAEEYKYVRLTECDDEFDYLVVGGCDHKVGQEDTTPRFDQLEQWTRQRFPQAQQVDYRWSGQISEPVDYLSFIGKSQGNDYIYIITGDSGDGLTHGVMAGRIIADEIEGVENPWAKVHSPKRVASVAKVLPGMIGHDLQVNAQYKRFLQSDITDIEDLGIGEGAVLNAVGTKPLAVYRDEDGNITKFSALCPHLKGVICWNSAEKSFDCPVHGSRFSKEGVCIMGPSKANLLVEETDTRSIAGKTALKT